MARPFYTAKEQAEIKRMLAFTATMRNRIASGRVTLAAIDRAFLWRDLEAKLKMVAAEFTPELSGEKGRG